MKTAIIMHLSDETSLFGLKQFEVTKRIGTHTIQYVDCNKLYTATQQSRGKVYIQDNILSMDITE